MLLILDFQLWIRSSKAFLLLSVGSTEADELLQRILACGNPNISLDQPIQFTSEPRNP